MIELKSPEGMPGNIGLSSFSDSFEFFTTQGWGLTRNYQRYGCIFKTNIFGKKYIVLVGPDANKLILQEKVDHLSSYLGWKPILGHLFGKPLLLQDGEEHKRTRRLMAPGFHGKALSTFFDTMQTTINEYFKTWAERSTVLLKNELNKMALKVAIRLILGVQLQHEIERIENLYNTLVSGAFTILRVDIPLTKYGRSQAARRQLKVFLQNIIIERKLQSNLQESRDVLGLLLASTDEQGNALSESQIIDELIPLVNAGHFTTGTSLTWAMVELATHPEWKKRLCEELVQVTQNEPLKVEHLRKLKQMSYFLKEIERLYNPAGAVIFRGVVKEIEYAGYRIPPGWTIVLAQALSHRLPEIYTNPEQFNPERFAPPYEEDKKHPFALIGFGGGEHSCIGIEFAKMEMSIFLATLLRQYDFSVTPSYKTTANIKVPFKVEGKLQLSLSVK